MKQIIWNRGKNKYETVKVYREKITKFLITTSMGKILLKYILSLPLVNDLLTLKKYLSVSKKEIYNFVEKYNISLKDYEKNISEFKSFSDFFVRKLKKGARKIDNSIKSIVSPADGQITIYNKLKENDLLYITLLWENFLIYYYPIY